MAFQPLPLALFEPIGVGFGGMDESPERRLRERVQSLGPGVRALLLTVLRLPQERRAARIGELWADERTRPFAELLIDVEMDIRIRSLAIAELKRTPA